jgi:hypothetical protein
VRSFDYTWAMPTQPRGAGADRGIGAREGGNTCTKPLRGRLATICLWRLVATSRP